MTRDEAARVLKAQVDYYGKLFASMVTAGDYSELRELETRMEALEVGADALRGPQPDPKTGIVPCGVCGKSPTYEEFNDGFFDLDRVECRGCGVMVTSACGKSKAKWNAMRGYKEADE